MTERPTAVVTGASSGIGAATARALAKAGFHVVPDCRLLVNNAGGAKGLEPVADADEDDWRWKFETNVIGTLRVTKALLLALLASGDGHIVTITSIAALGSRATRSRPRTSTGASPRSPPTTSPT